MLKAVLSIQLTKGEMRPWQNCRERRWIRFRHEIQRENRLHGISKRYMMRERGRYGVMKASDSGAIRIPWSRSVPGKRGTLGDIAGSAFLSSLSIGRMRHRVGTLYAGPNEEKDKEMAAGMDEKTETDQKDVDTTQGGDESSPSYLPFQSWEGEPKNEVDEEWPSEEVSDDGEEGWRKWVRCKWFQRVAFGASIGVAAVLALLVFRYSERMNARRQASGVVSTIAVTSKIPEHDQDDESKTKIEKEETRDDIQKEDVKHALDITSERQSDRKGEDEIDHTTAEYEDNMHTSQGLMEEKNELKDHGVDKSSEDEYLHTQFREELKHGRDEHSAMDRKDKGQKEKLPIRTPEGEAALAKIRKIQDSRRGSFQRQRDDEDTISRVRDEDETRSRDGRQDIEDSEITSRRESKAISREYEVEPVPNLKLEGHDVKEPVVAGRFRYDYEDKSDIDNSQDLLKWDADEIEKAVTNLESTLYADAKDAASDHVKIPEGMDISSMAARARVAHKAAALAANSAHRAMNAAGMSAEAAEKAVQEARLAALAASRCQIALETASEDAVKDAIDAAKQANELAAVAAQKAAVGAARAVIEEHQTSKHSQTAERASSLSSPHTLNERASAAWKQVCRGSDNARRSFIQAATFAKDKAMSIVNRNSLSSDSVPETDSTGERASSGEEFQDKSDGIGQRQEVDRIHQRERRKKSPFLPK